MKIRKFLSALLSCILIFSLTSPALATKATSSTVTISSDIKNQMLRVLASTEEEKENYGLSNLDFSEVHLGNEIPTYKVSEEKLIPANISLIPITDGTNLLSFFYISNDSSGSPFVQLSNELIAPLKNYVDGNPFAIIYDDNGAHVYTNNELHLLGLKEQSIFTPEDTSRHNNIVPEQFRVEVSPIMESTNNLVSLLNESCFDEISTKSYATTSSTLDVLSFIENISSPATSTATSKYLSVEKISQPAGTSICWAIAITSIANFIWNSNWHYTNIVQMFSNGVNKGLYTEEVIYNFNYYFDADWGYNYTTTLNPNIILSYLLDNYPLFGDFTYYNSDNDKGAHAVVIRGVSTTLRTFSIMNPTPSTTTYTSGTISTNNTLKFISGYSGNTFTLRSYGFPL